jgi:hypothetical protein
MRLPADMLYSNGKKHEKNVKKMKKWRYSAFLIMQCGTLR